MAELSDELLAIASDLAPHGERGRSTEVGELLKNLEDAAEKFKHASSGSWLGYHSRVYYEDFTAPPPGHHFSQEWGLMEGHYIGWKDIISKVPSATGENTMPRR